MSFLGLLCDGLELLIPLFALVWAICFLGTISALFDDEYKPENTKLFFVFTVSLTIVLYGALYVHTYSACHIGRPTYKDYSCNS